MLLLREAQQRQLQANIVTLSSAISACEKAGHWRTALQLLGEASCSGVELGTIAYNAAISACEKCCRWIEALVLLSEMSCLKLEQSDITRSASIVACARGAAWEQALCLFSDGDLAETSGSEMFSACASTISACEVAASPGAAQIVPPMLARVSSRILEQREAATARVLSTEILSDFGALREGAFRIQHRRLWRPMVQRCSAPRTLSLVFASYSSCVV